MVDLELINYLLRHPPSYTQAEQHIVGLNKQHIPIHLSSQGQNDEICWAWCVCLPSLFQFPFTEKAR